MTGAGRVAAIEGPVRPQCACAAEVIEGDWHYAFCVEDAWDREHGRRATRFVMADGTLSGPKVKRAGRWVDVS